MCDLVSLGFCKEFRDQVSGVGESLWPARVSNVERGLYSILGESGPGTAVLSGRFDYTAISAEDYPCVGDWVLLRANEQEGPHVIERLLGRRSLLSRKQVGVEGSSQLIAANVDFVFVVQSCNMDFSPRRMERYLLAVRESGAKAVIVLNKADLDPEGKIGFEAERVHRVSAVGGDLSQLDLYLKPGLTSVLVGSSGVGKSTLINRLCESEVQRTQEARGEDDKGRHTTTSRHMFVSRGGGLIIDTPGMREFGLAETDAAGSGLFDDIINLAMQCKFSNCAHGSEPGCAVHMAIAEGRLETERLRSFEKLQREEEYFARKSDARAASNAKKKWKAVTKMMRNHPSKTNR